MPAARLPARLLTEAGWVCIELATGVQVGYKGTLMLKMTAGFYASAVAELLSRKNLEPAERARLVEEIRQLAQFAADKDAAPFVKSSELAVGKN